MMKFEYVLSNTKLILVH